MSLPTRPCRALILAGRRTSSAPDAVADAGGRPVKALVEINGRSMLERVIATLRASQAVGDIQVSLPEEVSLRTYCPALAAEFAAGTLQQVAPSASPSASVRASVAPVVEQQRVLVTTGDHPLLTIEMIHEFLRAFAASGAEAAVALTDADRISERYPQSRRTKLAFSDGRFTGCNLFAFQGPGALHVLDFWRRVEQHRKHPWRIAHSLGWTTLILYAIGRLSLPAAMQRLSRRSGSRLHAVVLKDPHAGIDVDTPGDLELVRSILSQREH